MRKIISFALVLMLALSGFGIYVYASPAQVGVDVESDGADSKTNPGLIAKLTSGTEVVTPGGIGFDEKLLCDDYRAEFEKWRGHPIYNEIRVAKYFGTYSGCEVVHMYISDYYGTGTTYYVPMAGHLFSIKGWSLLVHKSHTFLDIKDAYEAGWVTANDIALIWNAYGEDHGYTAVDKSALNNIISKAEQLNEGSYTQESWSRMQIVLKETKETAALVIPHQEIVDRDVAVLELAISALVAQSSGNSNNGGGVGGGSISFTDASLSETEAAFHKDAAKDISVTLAKGDYALKDIKNGSYTLKSGTDYTVSGNTVAIKAAYLDSLTSGKHTVTFDMGGGTDPKLVITVSDGAGEAGDTKEYSVMKPSLSAGTAVNATKTGNPLFLGGVEKVFPAAKIDDYNWLKLRDIAMLLNGTAKQFSVSYDTTSKSISLTTGGVYTPVGDEMENLLPEAFRAIASAQQILLDGSRVDAAAYNIDGYNYLRLRDLAIMLDFAVIYDETDGTVSLDLTEPYTEDLR